MCGVIVVDAESFRSTWHGRDAYIHDHCLDILITMRFSINCSAVICSPTVIYAILREATSETYGPWVYFPSYNLLFYIILVSRQLANFCRRSFILQSLLSNLYNKNTKKYLLYYFYWISLLRVTVKGLTTPLSRWLRGVICFVQVRGTRA